ncbi:MAG: type II secretion system protein [Pseudomonadota bacterium]
MTVLILMVVAGIALIGVSRSWRTVVQRELESELLFRGNQIRKGIESYYKIGNNYPSELADLLKDPRFLVVRKHLRKPYPDPFAGDGKWALIRDINGRLIGVHSSSNGKPLKTGNFSEENTRFRNKKQYSDWKFIYEPSS